MVADYVTDLAARMASNATNNNALTDAQVKTVAVNAIKNDIDGGVVDAALSLPLTIPRGCTMVGVGELTRKRD